VARALADEHFAFRADFTAAFEEALRLRVRHLRVGVSVDDVNGWLFLMHPVEQRNLTAQRFASLGRGGLGAECTCVGGESADAHGVVAILEPVQIIRRRIEARNGLHGAAFAVHGVGGFWIAGAAAGGEHEAEVPDYKLLNQRYGERFKPQDMENLQPLPSGLTGPIRLFVEP